MTPGGQAFSCAFEIALYHSSSHFSGPVKTVKLCPSKGRHRQAYRQTNITECPHKKESHRKHFTWSCVLRYFQKFRARRRFLRLGKTWIRVIFFLKCPSLMIHLDLGIFLGLELGLAAGLLFLCARASSLSQRKKGIDLRTYSIVLPPAA